MPLASGIGSESIAREGKIGDGARPNPESHPFRLRMNFVVISFASKNVCGSDAILCFERPNQEDR